MKRRSLLKIFASLPLLYWLTPNWVAKPSRKIYRTVCLGQNPKGVGHYLYEDCWCKPRIEKSKSKQPDYDEHWLIWHNNKGPEYERRAKEE